ncbi:MAG: efflux RND transporter permease subunit [Limnochordia bacterium]|jgi:HAE1 family hydrophobic/amphiphilic exporter-1
MWLIKTAVKRPVACVMLIMVLIAVGFVSLTGVPLDLMPEMNLPFAVVMTNYGNAGPLEIESLVTRPLESTLATVGNLRNISSTSSRGSSMIMLEFTWGSDMDQAVIDVRERLDMVTGALPDDADKPLVVRFDPSSMPMMAVGLTGRYDLQTMREIAEDVISPRLERLDGVASVSVEGGLEREILVSVDLRQLDSYGLSIQTVTQALGAANLNLPGGMVTDGSRELTIRTLGEFSDVSQIGEVGLGPSLRLKDVAQIEDTFKEETTVTRLNGTPSVGLYIQKESGANTVQVAKGVRAELDRIMAEYAGRVDHVVFYDEADYIEDSISNVANNALIGALLAMLVLYIFLRNVRTTLIIGTAIPVAIISTFALLYFGDISLNMMSLGGLALGVGMLVDNGIVVLENIFRLRQSGYSAEDAAIEGAGEVVLAITGSTITTVAVFLPVLFVQGIAAQVFWDLALTVGFSLLASLLVSVTLIPMLAARLMRSGMRGAEQGNGFDRVFNRMLAWYRRQLDNLLGRRWLPITAIGVVFVASLTMIPRIGAEFLPEMDSGAITINVELPRGSLKEETEAIVSQVEAYAFGIPEVETVNVTLGRGGGFGGGRQNHVGSVDLSLVSLEERSRTTDEIVEEIRAFSAGLAGARISVTAQDMFGGGSMGAAPVSVTLRGQDLDELYFWADALAEKIKEVPGARETRRSGEEGIPEMHVTINRRRADELGTNVYQIASTIRTAVDGTVATRLRQGGTEIDVRVRTPEGADLTIPQLERLLVPTATGRHIPLYEVATLEIERGPISIQRFGQARQVTVNSSYAERDLGGFVADVQKAIESMGIPEDITVTMRGHAESMAESFGDLGIALLLAILLTYMILAALFESFIQPVTIMATVPLATIGVIWSLVLSGRAMSIVGLVGAILLVGIVVNNAIVLVEFMNQLRERGYERKEAIVEGAATRVRPVLMTSLTTIAGLIPLALGIGEGAEMGAPLAVVVAGGLTAATFLTLVIIPIVYSLFDDVEAWFSRLFNKLLGEDTTRLEAGHQG